MVIKITTAEAPISCVSPTIPYMTSTPADGRALRGYGELSTNQGGFQAFTIIFTTMMHHAPCVTSDHVVLN